MFRGVQLLADGEPRDYGAGVALLAVHAAIALADAIQIAATGERYAGETHARAAAEVVGICRSQKLDASGVKHLAWLLAQKNYFSYESKTVTEEQIKMAQARVERLFAWAYKTFPDLARLDAEEDRTNA